MDGQALKIAAAGCFALVILTTAVASRFDVQGSLANVFTTLGSTTTQNETTVTPVPTSQEWRGALSKYTTINPDVASSTGVFASSSMTMTDTFARAMFETYLRNRNEVDTTDSRVTFAQDYANAFLLSIEPTEYTRDDITISTDTTLSMYITAFTEAIAQTSEVTEHELVIFQRLAETVDVNTTDQALLVKIAENYTQIEKALLAVTMPEDLVATHLEFIAVTAGIRAHILDMSTIQQDPLRAAAGFNAYTESAEKLHTVIAALQQKIQLKQLTFPAGSLAARFMEL